MFGQRGAFDGKLNHIRLVVGREQTGDHIRAIIEYPVKSSPDEQRVRDAAHRSMKIILHLQSPKQIFKRRTEVRKAKAVAGIERDFRNYAIAHQQNICPFTKNHAQRKLRSRHKSRTMQRAPESAAELAFVNGSPLQRA